MKNMGDCKYVGRYKGLYKYIFPSLNFFKNQYSVKL